MKAKAGSFGITLRLLVSFSSRLIIGVESGDQWVLDKNNCLINYFCTAIKSS